MDNSHSMSPESSTTNDLSDVDESDDEDIIIEDSFFTLLTPTSRKSPKRSYRTPSILSSGMNNNKRG